MANDFLLNKIEGGELLVTNEASRFVQSGAINNIDTTSLDPKDLLWKVLDICASHGYAINPPTLFSPEHPIILRRIQVAGYSSDSVNFLFHWESPQLGPPTTYLIRKSTVLTPYQTNLLPGTRVPLRFADTTLAGLAGAVIPGHDAQFTFLKPLETIEIVALFYGEPRYVGNRVGNVNDAPWPTAGASLPLFGGHNPSQEQKPIAYWLITEWRTQEEKYAGYYSLNGAAMSRVDEDWSYSAILHDPNGHPIKLDTPDATAAAMMGVPYSKGIIYNANGMMRVGPYTVTSFPTLWGF